MSDMNVREDEINLYDYWKVIVKRKTLIIGLFFVAVLASAAISLSMPKIYRGEVVLKLPVLTAKELISIVGKLDAGKVKNILPKTYHLIADINFNALKDSTDKLHVFIEAKNKDALSQAASEFVTYLNDIPIIKRFVEEERQRFVKQSEELSKVIEHSNKLTATYDKLLKTGNLIPVGFNPVELHKRVSDLKIEKFMIEQSLQRPKGIEMIENPYILKNPVKPSIKKNIAFAGIISLFVGVFIAFFIEYVKKMRS